MEPIESNPNSRSILEAGHLQHRFDQLKQAGYRIMGPTLRDGAIIYDELNSIDDLPVGWTDEQTGATYRLKKREDAAFFGYAVGPHSWKNISSPPPGGSGAPSAKKTGFESFKKKKSSPSLH